MTYRAPVTNDAPFTSGQILVADDNASSCESSPTLFVDSNNILNYSLSGEVITATIGNIAQTNQAIIPAAGNASGLSIISYANTGPSLRQYNLGGGSIASPSALPSGGILFNNAAFGWNGSAIVRGGRIVFAGAENWTGPVNGTQFIIETVPAGSSGSSSQSAVFLAGWQCCNAGVAPTGGDKGGGTVNVQSGYYTQGVLNGTQGFLVSTLPSSPGTGARAYVTDATAPTFLGTLTGSGSVVCPVFYNGSAWVAG